MSVLGIGCDVLKISRIADLVSKHGLQSSFLSRFGTRILHTSELTAYQRLRQENNFEGVVRLLSGSWALKEAVYKSLGDDEQEKFRFKQWARGVGARGRPFIGSEEYTSRHPHEHFLATLSHDGDVLMATVLRQQQHGVNLK